MKHALVSNTTYFAMNDAILRVKRAGDDGKANNRRRGSNGVAAQTAWSTSFLEAESKSSLIRLPAIFWKRYILSRNTKL